MLKFSSFVFDMEQQVLYQEQKPVSLNPRQVQILTLFLSNPDKIFSKDDILDQVWDNRVVSEQVVFQNISHIRSLIGADAIKTFPKKGYQWQLPVEQLIKPEIKPDQELPASSETEQAVTRETPSGSRLSSNVRAQSPSAQRNITAWLAMALLLLVTVLGVTFLQPKETSKKPSQDSMGNSLDTVVFIPFAIPYGSDGQGQLLEINHLLSEQMTSIRSPQKEESHQRTESPRRAVDDGSRVADFFNSPFIYRQSLQLADPQLVISGYLHRQRSEEQGRLLLLEYLIQGKKRHWHGYIQAADVSDLTAKLQTQLNNLSQSQYFTLTAEAFTASELSLLHNQSPEDLDTLRHLVEAQLRGQQYQIAGAQIDLLLALSQQQQHKVYEALAHWLKGQLLLNLEQHALAKTELEQASLQMKRANFLPLQSEISKSLAEVVIPEKDFQLIRQYLYQAASEARLAERPVLEIRAYTLLSIRAAKLKLHEEKYDYLFRAKKLIADYQLDDSHFMLVFYHFALFAKDKAEQEAFYKKVLTQSVTPENYWVFFSASQFLAEIYGERRQWQEALALTDDIYEQARRTFLLTKIYLAKGDVENTLTQAKISFNSARTQHIHWIGLEMALVLLELQQTESSLQLDSADALMYRRYIQNNFSDWWAQRNRKRLQAVGIELNPYSQNSDL